MVLEHMFHPSEMEEEATLREDLQDDIKTECLKMGPVEKVRAICICLLLSAMASNATTAMSTKSTITFEEQNSVIFYCILSAKLLLFCTGVRQISCMPL